MAVNLKFKKGNINSPVEKGSIIIDSDNKKIYLDTSTSERILIGTTDYNDLSNQPTLVKTGGDVTITNGIISVNDNSHNHEASNITSGTIATARLPAASGTAAGITVVYPAASCTTFSSDSGTVTPAAVQKGAKQFSIPRPNYNQSTHTGSATVNSIPRFEEDGAVKDSKITIEEVTNTKDSSKKANVLVIPAEGGKKMVYGYCTDQVDGTSFIGGVFDASATTYPYASGLAIGGTSGNLLWKGSKVAVITDIPTVNNGTLTIQKNGTNVATFTANQSGNATANITVPTKVSELINDSGFKTTDNNTTYTFATGDGNGQIKVTPSGGSAQNISVKGLGSAAYTASTAYRASSWTPTAEDVGAMPATGGTFSNWAHRIEKSDVAGRNVSARDRAIIRTTAGHETSYCCGASLKTVEGTWDIGTRDNDLIFQYATDANFNAGTNTVLTGFRVTDEGEIVVGAGSYGNTLPTGGVAGQVFFKI